MVMSKIIKNIQTELKNRSDEKVKESSQRFFKEEIKVYGVKAAIVHKIAKENFKLIKDKPKLEIFKLCEELLQSGYTEEALIAYDWSYFIRKKYEPTDFLIFEKWVDTYITNWATCDTLCNHTIGTFIVMYPNYLNDLIKWTQSENRWKKRAAAVSLIVPARRGHFINEILKIADLLLLDKDDMVQKGYGWMLKEASKVNQKEIFNFVISKKATMPRTALRYAIEKLPNELRTEAMKKNN
ncbi:3-methyladenine DNA glycosylase AlkD [Lutibacter flavus]|uniref:3-methyladenine DNA glycosylase AlkD n=2 Tax=Lutibacter flavus TaxID=691689 RepID=A0A238VDC7_9FLAO|nr:3-methyladenine DNA glycosylase AlkD [Lutibacter flavus]